MYPPELRCTRNPDKPYDLPRGATGESARRHRPNDGTNNMGKRAASCPSDSARCRISRRRAPLSPRRSPWRRRLPGDNRLPVHSARRYLCGMHRAPLLLETPRSRTCAFQWRRPEEINRWAARALFLARCTRPRMPRSFTRRLPWSLFWGPRWK